MTSKEFTREKVAEIAQQLIHEDSLESIFSIKGMVKGIAPESTDQRAKLDRWLLLILINEQIMQKIDYIDFNLYRESNEWFDLAHDLSLVMEIDLRDGLSFYEGMCVAKIQLQGLINIKTERERYFKEALVIAEHCASFYPSPNVFEKIIEANL